MPSAEWWREYRRRRREELRAYNRTRRRSPRQRAQRAAQELRRRARRRAEQGPLPALHTGHPILEQARALVPTVVPGTALLWWREALAQDLASEAVLAILEGRSPEEAVAAYRAREHTWARLVVPLVA